MTEEEELREKILELEEQNSWLRASRRKAEKKAEEAEEKRLRDLTHVSATKTYRGRRGGLDW